MTERGPRILFYVQHLLGIGHLVRSGRIAAGLARSGFETLLVSGGLPVPGLWTGRARLHQLTPVRAGEGGFSSLVHADGRPFGPADQAERREALLALLESFAPDVLLIEAFPFGRRAMRFELIPLLERAKAAGVLIASSVRDILQKQNGPERIAETSALVHCFFDLVLVHGDGRPALEETFPAAASFRDRIVYTGMVGPAHAEGGDELGTPGHQIDEQGRQRANEPIHDVIVSAGGGAVGAGLIGAALGARDRLIRQGNPAGSLRWLVVTGPNHPDPAFAVRSPGPGLTLARFLPDLPQRLALARLSVSQAGYNTVADVLAAGCAAVLVPFAAGGETEQTMRAEALARSGRAIMVAEAELDAVRLAEAISQALLLATSASPPPLDGAARTAEILAAHFEARLSGGRSA